MPCGTMAVTEWYMSYFLLCLLLTSVTANPQEVCIGNKYVAYNQKAIISCDYTRSFYTVRWFLGDNENPLLRIDDAQKSGYGFASGEYDIKMDGSMVITRATTEHEGRYTMSVLGKDGSVATGRINIHVVGMTAENIVYLGDVYVDLHSRISISCECNPLFSTVYWYFDDSDISILFIDDGVKGGSGRDSGEYDITDDGAMTINSADKQHNGKYEVFVLDQSGGGTTKTLMVHVTVPINTLTILDCHSSQSELQDEEQPAFLVCDANDFWPSIKLQWLQITQNGSTPVPTDTTTTFDESSLLFSSTSTLKYFPESFSYQYFTCVASGTAAYKVSNNSIVIEGNIPFQKLPPVDAHLMKGSDLKLACPLDDLPFGQLQLEFRNGTNKLINIINPYCANNGTCVESDSKVTTIANINYEDEGSYTCISTNGEIATTRVTHVTTIILPGKSSTIFGGCERVKRCSRTLSTSGSVTCSISGVRPPVQLSLEIDYVEEAVKDKLMLHNKGESITQDDSTGTSTTTLTFDYEVPECTEMIRLRCFSLPDEYNRHFQESTLLLQADVDDCSNDGSGSAVVVVIVVISVVVIIGIVLTGVFVIRRKVQRKVPKQAEESGNEENEQPLLSVQKHEQENDNKEKKQKTLNVDSKKLSKKSEKKKFDELMRAYVISVEDNQTERKDLQTQLQEFQQNNKHKVDIWPLLKSFVEAEAESLKHETTLSIVKEFAACERNDWLSSENSVVELLDIAFKKQQLSFQDRLKIANEMHVNKTISKHEYASETINNFEGHKEQFREVFNEQCTTQGTVQEDVIGTMFECLTEYLKKRNDSKEEDDRDKFLHSICQLQNDLHVILYTLLLCIEKKAGDVKQITAVLQDNINETEIREYCGMIPELQWLTIHTLVQFRKGLTRKGLHTGDVLMIELTTLFINGQLPTSTFLAELESSRNENLISEKTRTSHICSWATTMSNNIPTEVIYGAIQRGLIEVKTFVETVGDKWNIEDGVKLLLHISKTNNESEKTTPRIIQDVIRHYKVSEALLEGKFDDKWGKEDWVKFLLVISQRNQKIDEKAADVFLVAIKTFKITPSDLESIFESLNTPNEERIKVLTNEKVAEHFLNQKLDEKWGKEKWFNFLLLQSKGSEIFEPKANEVFLEVIKKFKITLSGMDSILGSLKIPNEQRIMILENEKVSEYFLKQPLDKEWDKESWIHFLLLSSDESKDFRKDIMAILVIVIKDFMITPTEMKTILDNIEISEIKKKKIMTHEEIQRKLKKT